MNREFAGLLLQFLKVKPRQGRTTALQEEYLIGNSSYYSVSSSLRDPLQRGMINLKR